MQEKNGYILRCILTLRVTRTTSADGFQASAHYHPGAETSTETDYALGCTPALGHQPSLYSYPALVHKRLF